MKVKVLGNGLTWSKRAGSCFLVNDEILVDVPQGIMKNLWDKLDFLKLKYVVITHFHSDHFADLHILVDKICKVNRSNKLIIIAPKNALSSLMKIYKITAAFRSKQNIKKFVDFKVIKGGGTLNLDGFTLQAYDVEHGIKDCVGYVLTDKSGKSVGFSGDTEMCDGLIKIVEKADTIFIDTANTFKEKRHLCTQEVIALRKQYKKKRFYSVHMVDEVYENFKNKLLIPEIDEIVDI